MSTKATTISAIITNQGLTVVFPSGVRMMSKTEPTYEGALRAYRENNIELLEEIMSPKLAIAKFAEGKITFDADGNAMLAGKVIDNYAITKIRELQAADLPWRPLARFMEKLLSNPSSRAVSELYRFLETENLPLTEDGDFLAYKRVRDDWKDFHTGKILNLIGTEVTEPRNEVDDDPSHGCSRGLHAGALSYVNGFNSGGHLIIVKINPADVVSIPHEDVRKLRTCRYFVVQEMEDTLTKSPLYRNDSATPIHHRYDLNQFEDEDNTDYEEDENDENWDDLEDNEHACEVEQTVSELREMILDIVGLPVATDVLLSRVLSKKEQRLFRTCIENEYDVEFSEVFSNSDIAKFSIEEIAEELNNVY